MEGKRERIDARNGNVYARLAICAVVANCQQQLKEAETLEHPEVQIQTVVLTPHHYRRYRRGGSLTPLCMVIENTYYTWKNKDAGSPKIAG